MKHSTESSHRIYSRILMELFLSFDAIHHHNQSCPTLFLLHLQTKLKKLYIILANFIKKVMLRCFRKIGRHGNKRLDEEVHKRAQSYLKKSYSSRTLDAH